MKIERVGTGTTVSRVLAIAGLVIGLGGCGVSDGTTLPGAASPDGESKLGVAAIPAGTWRLVSMREAGQAEAVIGQPGTFTAEFGVDGRLSLRADCNRCTAGYSADSRSLNVGLMACTRAFCVATTPLDTTYTALVGSARTWSVSGDGRLELASDAGTLRFQR
jgi:heat shock protein HslJ